ncbi:unnamed protein product, partial [Choristocarpus tenellus]
VPYIGNLKAPLLVGAGEGYRNILLLHGAKYSAGTWLELGTITLLAEKGYRVAAVNLPVKERSRSREDLLVDICDGLGMGKGSSPVIVSPSMSGTFSVPFLLHNTALIRAYVPVAPGEALRHTAEEFAAVEDVPALIVYGEEDSMGAQASQLLANIPGSDVLMVPDAPHAAYLFEPNLFHDKLLEFFDTRVFSPSIQ